MRQYQEEADDVVEILPQVPHQTFIFGLQHENRHIKELQEENRELRIALDEHQSALELIMSKYRQQILKYMARPVYNSPEKVDTSEDIEKKNGQICHMVDVMNQAVVLDDLSIPSEIEIITQLRTENKGLREMLEVCNTQQQGILHSVKQVQTDPIDMESSITSDGSAGDTVLERSDIRLQDCDTSYSSLGEDTDSVITVSKEASPLLEKETMNVIIETAEKTDASKDDAAIVS